MDLAAPVGALMLSSFSGSVVPGGSNTLAGQLGVRRLAQGFAAIVDFSALGSPTYTAKVYSGSNLVLSASGLSGESVRFTLSAASRMKCKYKLIPPKCVWTFGYGGGAADASFTIAGVGTNLLGNEIVFTPDVILTNPIQLTQVDMLGQHAAVPSVG